MKLNLLFLFFIYISFFADASYAYLDPGTGSMVISVIVGLIATFIYIFRGWFYALKNKFFKKDK